MAQFKVLIAGAGLGGLCLAQTLRRHDVDVDVFERDTSPWDRPQGYRLHIDADGVDALYQALTPDLYTLFDATSMKPLPFTTIVDTNLAIQRRLPSDEHGSTQDQSSHGRPSHVNVNRATLRQILFTGLEDSIHFGKRLSQYESDEKGVTVTFEDGTHSHRGSLSRSGRHSVDREDNNVSLMQSFKTQVCAPSTAVFRSARR